MKQSRGLLLGYRLEWCPGDYVFETPEHFAKEICRNSARIWGLYTEPQSGCSNAAAVYLGPHWIQPKYVYGKCLDGFKPLYLGPLLYEPAMDEDVLFAFPGIIEERLRADRPDLFADERCS